MLPSSIRRSATFDADSAEVEGALSHASIAAGDLAEGRFDGAQVRIGIIDWETNERQILYRGAIGAITEEAGRFTAELASRKLELAIDPIPRTSPSCRAAFCGPGCNLSPTSYTHDAVVVSTDEGANAIQVSGAPNYADCVGGAVRWFDGPHAGMTMQIMTAGISGLVLDTPIGTELLPGLRLSIREGCDHTLATCSTRFNNAANFQGEPFLPGNDLLTRYPAPAQ